MLREQNAAQQLRIQLLEQVLKKFVPSSSVAILIALPHVLPHTHTSSFVKPFPWSQPSSLSVHTFKSPSLYQR